MVKQKKQVEQEDNLPNSSVAQSSWTKDKSEVDADTKRERLTAEYKDLKLQLQAFRESRPVSTENLRDQQAAEWFSKLKDDIEKKIQSVSDRYTGLFSTEDQKRKSMTEDIDAKIEKLLQTKKRLLEESDIRLERYRQQQNSENSGLKQKLEFVENRLQSAQLRTRQSVKKTKAEILVTERVKEIITFMKSNYPDFKWDMYIPGHSSILEETPIPPLISKKPEGGGGIPTSLPISPEPKNTSEKTSSQPEVTSKKEVDPPLLSSPPQKTSKVTFKEPLTSESSSFLQSILPDEKTKDEVVMPYPDGTPMRFQFGKRVPKSGSLQNAVAKQDAHHSGLPFEPVEQVQEQPPNRPKIIRFTKKSEEQNNE